MATAAERLEQESNALELRRAGVSVRRIMAECGFATVRQAEAVIARAMKAAAVLKDPLAVRDLELDRLDRLQQSVWLKAVKGDVAAIDRVMRLSELRMRLAGVADTGVGQMSKAFEETVGALAVQTADAALLMAGRRIADRVDQAFASGDPTAETKALYLVPHLINVLRELGATPEARRAMPKGGQSVKSAKLTALRGGKSA